MSLAAPIYPSPLPLHQDQTYTQAATEFYTRIQGPADFPHERLILVDIDGVLVDWIAGFHPYAQRRLHQLNLPPLVGTLSYDTDLRAALAPGNPTLGQQIIMDFQTSMEAEDIPTFPDAVLHLRAIADEFAVRYVAVSTAGVDPAIAERRINLLDAKFGADLFHGYHFLPPLTNKSEALKLYRPTVFIDDMPKQTVKALEFNHLAILLHREGTTAPGPEHPRSLTFKSWAGIHDLLRDYFALLGVYVSTRNATS